MIKLIDNVNLYHGAGDVTGFSQGTLDGACGIYSVVTAMVAGGVISRDEAINAWSTIPDGRTRLANATVHLPALVQDGTDETDQIKLIKALEWHIRKTKTCKPELIDLSGKKLFPEIIGRIDRSIPVIIHLNWEGSGAHAAVVVGYEFEDNDVYHLLTIDPGYNISRVQLWNAVLTCYRNKNGKKPYYYRVENFQLDSHCQITKAVALTG